MSEKTAIHLIFPDSLVPPSPTDAEVELIASTLGELLVSMLRFDDSAEG